MTPVLDVRVEIAAEREEDLNEWYARHVPHLMRTPGYVSGRRYLALEGEPRYAALYEIQDESCLPSLLGDDPELRHELTTIDLPAWESELVPHMNRCDFNVWAAAGRQEPFLVDNYPVVQARVDTSGDRHSGAVIDWYDQVVLPEIATEPDVVAVTRLEPSGHPAVAWIQTQPDALILVQVTDDEAARRLAGADAVRRLADRPEVAALEITPYRQLLFHAPFRPAT